VADQAELDIDVELDELEIRLERLRALYEQYFLGIERIEPTVARKDVDRRVWTLRHEKIRNTAKRFKFQTIIQRYNTFQQYWQRICREIENGTYQRHLLKAEKMLGEPLTIAAKRRRGAYGRKGKEAEKEAEAKAAAAVAETKDDLDDILGLRATPKPPRKAAGEPSAMPTAPGVPSGPRPSERPRYKFERLDLDIDDLIGGGGAPVSARPSARPPAAAPSPSGPPIARRARSSTAPPPVAPQPPPEHAKPKPPPLPSRTKPAIPSRAPAANSPTRAPSSRPAAGKGEAPPRVGPPISVRRPPTAASPAAASSGLSDQRMREIHQRLSDAKRQVNDPKAVSLEGLSKQLRATEQSLRQRHGGRSVDFDVVVKDGRAVLKPIVKKR
jgi:hypothetical protein